MRSASVLGQIILCEGFEECRKYGLHILLVHQNLGQLQDAGERVFSTVTNEAKIETYFKIKEPVLDIWRYRRA